jgi:archaellum component FlaG (FlaF/FlaG flagellin family)
VKVVRNQETTLSLADIAIEPKQTGSVLFMVTPGDANVYIDGKKVNTEGAVDIVYGKHSILIQADGYESYSANFNVNYAYKIKEYTLTPSDDSSSSTTESSTSSGTTTATTQSSTTTETTTETSTTESSTSTSSSTNKETSNKVIVSSPSGASVYLDGEYIGIAPISFTKVTGSHIITFSQTGYLSKSYTETFTDDGQDTTLTYDALTSIASLIQ